MRRSKIGDVYAFQTERGYRLFQFAYKVVRIGKFYRVFPNFYSEIPENLREIILGDYSYLIWYNVATGFRSGLFQFLGNIADRDAELDGGIKLPCLDQADGLSGDSGLFCQLCLRHFQLDPSKLHLQIPHIIFSLPLSSGCNVFLSDVKYI